MFAALRLDSVTSLLSTVQENRFSITYLKQLHKQLSDHVKCINTDNESQIIEILRIIAEMTVYGDSKSEILFDFFCEKNMLALFIEIMNNDNCPVTVQVQILQTLSIMIGCVRNDTSLYYLLSNNHVNKIIIFPFDLDSENVRDHYVSFLKSLSMRLNKQTVNFFFIEETTSLPLFSKAIKLLRIDDNMSKIACQTIILNVLKVEDDMCRSYVLQDNILHTLFDEIVYCMINYYKCVILKLQEFSVSTHIHNNGSNANAIRITIHNELSDIFSSVDDWLYYIIDLLELKIPHLTHNLIAHLFEKFVDVYIIPVFSFTSTQSAIESTRAIISNPNDNSKDNQRFTDSQNTERTEIDIDNKNSTESYHQHLNKTKSTGSLYRSIMDKISNDSYNPEDNSLEEENHQNNIVDMVSEYNYITIGVSLTFLTKILKSLSSSKDDISLLTLTSLWHPLCTVSQSQIDTATYVDSSVVVKDNATVESNMSRKNLISLLLIIVQLNDFCVHINNQYTESATVSLSDVTNTLSSPTHANHQIKSILSSLIAHSLVHQYTNLFSLLLRSTRLILESFVVDHNCYYVDHEFSSQTQLTNDHIDDSVDSTDSTNKIQRLFRLLLCLDYYEIHPNNKSKSESDDYDAFSSKSIEKCFDKYDITVTGMTALNDLNKKMKQRNTCLNNLSFNNASASVINDKCISTDTNNANPCSRTMTATPVQFTSIISLYSHYLSSISITSLIQTFEIVHTILSLCKICYLSCVSSIRQSRNLSYVKNGTQLSMSANKNREEQQSNDIGTVHLSDEITDTKPQSLSINIDIVILKSTYNQIKRLRSDLCKDILNLCCDERNSSSILSLNDILDVLQDELSHFNKLKWSTLGSYSNKTDIDILIELSHHCHSSLSSNFVSKLKFSSQTKTIFSSFDDMKYDLFSIVESCDGKSRLHSIFQRLLLVRSLTSQISILLTSVEEEMMNTTENSNRNITSVPPPAVSMSWDQNCLTTGVVDDTLKEFISEILVPLEMKVGAIINMRGRKFLDALVYMPIADIHDENDNRDEGENKQQETVDRNSESTNASISSLLSLDSLSLGFMKTQGTSLSTAAASSPFRTRKSSLSTSHQSPQQAQSSPVTSSVITPAAGKASATIHHSASATTTTSPDFKMNNRLYEIFGKTDKNKHINHKNDASSRKSHSVSTPTLGSRKQLKEVLLVQNTTLLLLVKTIPSTHSYEIILSLPLFQIESVSYMEQKVKLKIVVKSWEENASVLTTLPTYTSADIHAKSRQEDSDDEDSVDNENMTKAYEEELSKRFSLSKQQLLLVEGSENEPTTATPTTHGEAFGDTEVFRGSISSTASVHNNIHHISISTNNNLILQPKSEKIFKHDIILLFDNENSCALALKYLETTSQNLRADKLNRLRTILVAESET